MIRTFADPEAERLWRGERSRKLPQDIQERAFYRLKLIDAAASLDDLRNPPSNRLHALADDRAGQHSVSINKKWRICFVWHDGGADGVEITDYH
ncbi:MAG: plasmid maintenance system killer [Proteobacteria bacterium ST_bin13]|nr:MAG: plasmid maintenance system killer [Proteobacteria bacterium ST_bin13]